ncbi:anti-sigma regulatory factor [Oscillatoriales cyanobacterium LEGE 11467]|uniref:Anti-sigma regulatory factor n=1 Tax=Zarconia navalis LEGE 11467 TaxID=1828826 RepID=A0A928Z6L7_9CYAN|nr:anti-sigma regulatory factor [Zarconia navalis]MBE9040507.1 anti-sigma regulatory factor [Zarconia navalis LEGE 11467]
MALSKRPPGRQSGTISFASTLYLGSVLDLLLAEVPDCVAPEIRLGLQEALVNAVKHGNQLDPSKTIEVHFCVRGETYQWSISDGGKHDIDPCRCSEEQDLPEEESECGRGMFILQQIFDRVEWNSQRCELQLCKQVKGSRSLATTI